MNAVRPTPSRTAPEDRVARRLLRRRVARRPGCAWRRATIRVALRPGADGVRARSTGSEAMRGCSIAGPSTAVRSVGGAPCSHMTHPLQECRKRCTGAVLWTQPPGRADHGGSSPWRSVTCPATHAAHHPVSAPRRSSPRPTSATSRWPRHGNLYLLTDPRGDIRLDGRGLGPVRARHAHPVDLDPAPQRRAADAPARAVPRRRRRHDPADQPGAAPQPGRQATARPEPRPPRAERDPDPPDRGRPARAGDDRELLGDDRGARGRARAGRRHGRHLRGPRLSAAGPRHALPDRGRRRPGRCSPTTASTAGVGPRPSPSTSARIEPVDDADAVAGGERRRPLAVAPQARPAADHRVDRRYATEPSGSTPPPVRPRPPRPRSRHRRRRPRPTGRVVRSGVPSSRSSSRSRFGPRAARPDADPLARRPGRAAQRRARRRRALPRRRDPVVRDAVRARQHHRRARDGRVHPDASPSRRSMSWPASRRRPTTRGTTPSRARSSTRCGPARWHGPARRRTTPYYGSIDSTPLWLILLGEAHAWTGDDAAARAALAERPGGPRLDRRLGRPRWRRVRRVPAPLAARPAQPGLEGLGRRDPPHRRPAGRRPDRAGRGPGLRLRRQAGDGAAGPPSRRDGAGGPARSRRRRPARPVRRGVLDARRRASTRWRSTARSGRSRASARTPGQALWTGIVPAARAGTRRRTDARARHVLRLGRPDVRLGSARLQPGRLPHGLDLAARQRADRGRPQGERRGRRREPHRRPADRGRPVVPGPAPARALLRVRAGRRRRAGRLSGRLLAAGLGGRRAVLPAPRRCSACAPTPSAHRLELVRPTLPDWLGQADHHRACRSAAIRSTCWSTAGAAGRAPRSSAGAARSTSSSTPDAGGPRATDPIDDRPARSSSAARAASPSTRTSPTCASASSISRPTVDAARAAAAEAMTAILAAVRGGRRRAAATCGRRCCRSSRATTTATARRRR